ncbi:MAG: amino acid ABC transporter permease [Gammaproteobacteria bacterium]|nr:MAG: amino acid ABC transporter permease [Gammaproteobacteria bacterium]
MSENIYKDNYLPGEHPDLPPPIKERGILYWLRKNLFSSLSNTILTLLSLALIFYAFPPLIDWAIIHAAWGGTDPALCQVEGTGACWTFINARLGQFIYGFYPEVEKWRANIVFVLFFGLIAYLVIPNLPKKTWVGVFTLTGLPVITFILLSGNLFGLANVPTSNWGGLMLTLVISFIGIVASLPLGIILALGRRSDMPIVKSVCIAFIELWRGVPLITVLFMSSVMFPLFLPEGVNFDKLLRALIGIALFSSAYMAEVVRGGLQAIPKGQTEAAQSLGLSFWKTMSFIILPQALKIVIPGIVNTFIGLFKDTTLVLIIGLFDFLGIIQAASQDPKWLGYHTEGYVFAALVYFIFCFSMSRYSMYLERKLHTGHKR